MSHIVSIETKITDLGALKAAVEAKGWEWREGQTSYRWFGEFVGDTPMPEGMTVEDLGTCSHAVRIPGCKYEVGVLKGVDGSHSIVYDYWERSMNEALGQNAGPLIQAYAVQKTLAEARRMGRGVLSQTTLASGAVEILVAGR